MELKLNRDWMKEAKYAAIKREECRENGAGGERLQESKFIPFTREWVFLLSHLLCLAGG